ncbi:hypothetical protein GQR58_029634 [Nymphon striatum]|nr:hypothetical protein GQR58_029634 [Nymphon striatum]
MMFRNTFAKWLWDARRSITVWALAISAVGGLYAALWPTVNDPAFQQALESYPEGLLEAMNYDDVATPAGYLTSSVYGLIGALLLLIYATSAGARTVAGDEQAGTLELVLGHPISRTKLALLRYGALVVSVMFMCAFFLLVMLALRSPAQLTEISMGGFVAMHVHLALFTIFFGAVAYAVGAATGRRGWALGAGATVGVVAVLGEWGSPHGRWPGLGLGQDQPDHRSRRGPSTVELHEGELRVERWLGLRGMTVDVRTSVRRRRIRHPSGSAQRVFLTGSWWAEVSPAPELSNQGESNPVDERR